MKTIRKYAESGYDLSALSPAERDALMDEARLVAAALRGVAIRKFFGRIAKFFHRPAPGYPGNAVSCDP